VLHLSRKIILANLKMWCSKMRPISENHPPGLRISVIGMSLALCLPRELHLCRSSWNIPLLPAFLKLLQKPSLVLTFGKVQNHLRLPRQMTLERPKVVRTCGAFSIYIRTTAACNFWIPELPKLLGECGAFSLLFDLPHPQKLGNILSGDCSIFRAPGFSLYWFFLFWHCLFCLFLFSGCSHLLLYLSTSRKFDL
jgi:hypothetical protein